MNKQYEINLLRSALGKIEEEMVDDTSERAQRINKIIQEALAFEPDKPILKKGDKVLHAKNKNYGIGEVLEISKSGKKVKVYWKNEKYWGSFSAYYDPSSLQKVEEASQ